MNRRSTRLIAWLAPSAAVLTACPITPAPAGFDTGTETVARAEPCNSVVLRDVTVVATHMAGPTPTPRGGTLLDGTYVLTRLEYFETNATPLDGAFDRSQITFALTGDSAQAVFAVAGGVATENYAIRTADLRFTAVHSCRDSTGLLTAVDGFTASGTELQLSSSGVHYVATFVRQ